MLALASAGSGCAATESASSTTGTTNATAVPRTVGTSRASTTTTAAKVIATTAKKATTTTTTTSSTTRESTTSTKQTPTSAAPTDAAGFAQALYDAWKAGDQTAAATVANPAAVAAMFAQTYAAADGPDGPAEPYTFADCSGAAGSTICSFHSTSTSQVLLMTVRNTTGGEPMLVTGVKITAAGG